MNKGRRSLSGGVVSSGIAIVIVTSGASGSSRVAISSVTSVTSSNISVAATNITSSHIGAATSSSSHTAAATLISRAVVLSICASGFIGGGAGGTGSVDCLGGTSSGGRVSVLLGGLFNGIASGATSDVLTAMGGSSGVAGLLVSSLLISSVLAFQSLVRVVHDLSILGKKGTSRRGCTRI